MTPKPPRVEAREKLPELTARIPSIPGFEWPDDHAADLSALRARITEARAARGRYLDAVEGLFAAEATAARDLAAQVVDGDAEPDRDAFTRLRADVDALEGAAKLATEVANLRAVRFDESVRDDVELHAAVAERRDAAVRALAAAADLLVGCLQEMRDADRVAETPLATAVPRAIDNSPVPGHAANELSQRLAGVAGEVRAFVAPRLMTDEQRAEAWRRAHAEAADAAEDRAAELNALSDSQNHRRRPVKSAG